MPTKFLNCRNCPWSRVCAGARRLGPPCQLPPHLAHAGPAAHPRPSHSADGVPGARLHTPASHRQSVLSRPPGDGVSRHRLQAQSPNVPPPHTDASDTNRNHLC